MRVVFKKKKHFLNIQKNRIFSHIFLIVVCKITKLKKKNYLLQNFFNDNIVILIFFY